MLRSFKKQLILLANNPNDKFYEKVCGRMGGIVEERAISIAEDLKRLILLMPTLLLRIHSLWRGVKAASPLKNAASYFLVYLYHPQDFLPENERNGLFGYLDDAYLTALFYELVLEELTHEGSKLNVEDKKLLHEVIGLKRKTQSVIPEEASKIQYMAGEILDGEDDTFSEMFQSNEATERS